MKKKWILLIFLFLAVIAVRMIIIMPDVKDKERLSNIETLKGLEVKYLLTPELFDSLPNPVNENFDVTSNETIIMNCDSTLLGIEADEDSLVASVLIEKPKAPESFALDGDSVLLTICGRFFGKLEEDNETALKAVPLPYETMRLAPSAYPGVVYLFAGKEAITNRVYAFLTDGTFRIIVDLPDKIVDVADNTLEQVYIATQKEIYRVSPTKSELVIRLPVDVSPIVSIGTLSDNNQLLFFSTKEKVYALHGSAAIALVKNAGGVLRICNNKLYLFDPNRHLMVSISGLAENLLSKKNN